jgi:hypothetical protein
LPNFNCGANERIQLSTRETRNSLTQTKKKRDRGKEKKRNKTKQKTKVEELKDDLGLLEISFPGKKNSPGKEKWRKEKKLVPVDKIRR